jgi:hypothetical protein
VEHPARPHAAAAHSCRRAGTHPAAPARTQSNPTASDRIKPHQIASACAECAVSHTAAAAANAGRGCAMVWLRELGS